MEYSLMFTSTSFPHSALARVGVVALVWGQQVVLVAGILILGPPFFRLLRSK